MNTLFISDVHLHSDHPDTAAIFLNFLKTHHTKETDAIYILGDLFESWLGDNDLSAFNQKIIRALKNLTDNGIAIYLMHGNRDFLIGKQFLQRTGCQLLQDPTVINLYGVSTLLMHGDLLCIDDVAYLNYRDKVQHPLFRKFFLALPLFLRKKIAKLLRRKSQKEVRLKDIGIMDANLKEVKKMLQKHMVSLLIHGHTHRPSIEYFKLKDDFVCRIVLNDWHDHGNVLICNANGERRLINFF